MYGPNALQSYTIYFIPYFLLHTASQVGIYMLIRHHVDVIITSVNFINYITFT